MKKMKIFKFTCLLAAAVMFSTSCSTPKAATEHPKFWTWMGYSPNANWDSLFMDMKNNGFEGVLMSADSAGYEAVIPYADKHGIELHAWVWSLNVPNQKLIEEHPDWYSVNRLGHSLVDSQAYVGYYKFLCPIVPEAREYVKNNFRKLCQIKGLKAISLDYHRFVDVILPTTLWDGYGIVQDKEYAQWDYGYHPMMIEEFKKQYGYDPRDQEDPSQDEKWLQFRCDLVSSLANEIADIAHENGKLISASPFPTPKMSRTMVRQDWGKWKLDMVFPMVYHGFYTRDMQFITDCTEENAIDKYPTTELFCGLHAPDFGGDAAQIKEGVERALKAGAKGVAFYTYSGLNPEQKAVIKTISDSLKNVK